MSEQDTFLKAYDVSRETLERLVTYEELLKKWNPAINLVSPKTLSQVWSRHFLDSAQVFTFCPENAQTWGDLGSGAGFPGLVVAILAAEKRPELRVSLVESDQRKAAFLMTVIRKLGLTAKVHAARIETLPPLQADIIGARALASLDELLGFSARHLRENGICLFQKGAQWRDEVAKAREHWSFVATPYPSVTDEQAVILKIERAQRV